jgi:probable phosphomutase (TIGR03848 family)
VTTFYLIRHASNDSLGKTIAGRTGVRLNALGRQQAEALAEKLSTAPITRIFSSPLERTRETALPLAHRLGLPIEISEALNEINYGDWTGQTLAQLAPLETWKQWNSFRSGTRAPHGELMIEAQQRIIAGLESFHAQFPNQSLALFSHGDVIKAALACYLGISLDLLQRIEISPASVTLIARDEHGVRVLAVNSTFKAA